MNIDHMLRLFFTLRHIKPIQFYWRIYLKFNKLIKFNNQLPQVILTNKIELLAPVPKFISLKTAQFVFINHSIPISYPIAWNNTDQTKLWLYNLHYFDYLNQPTINITEANTLINDWIGQNEIGQGNGWEPYPISLRIVNWIKYLSWTRNGTPTDIINQSLYLQCRFLFEHLEYHLLGNHLFKNGVALIYAGTYFQGAEASAWLNRGLNIFISQIREQVLPDGGHFERSPMYHLLILEDILDCLNLNQSISFLSEDNFIYIKNITENMLRFTMETVHQDGEIAFFNDCALRIAPKPDQILEYASRLGLNNVSTDVAQLTDAPISIIEKPNFGLYALQNLAGKLIFDVGVIGPDYLPGHAHCDTLSYELSLFGHRCIVNSGTYQYAGNERNDFRATSAHNTVRIDAQEQHEIWSTFRVARRGYPCDVMVNQQSTSIEVSASHNGYTRLSGKPMHRRSVVCRTDSYEINDVITGNGSHLAESYIHLGPTVEIDSFTDIEVNCSIGNHVFTISTQQGCIFDLQNSFFSLEFGLKTENRVLVLKKEDICPIFISYKITSSD
jgi:uncharacterized heparinase superfamily protein